MTAPHICQYNYCERRSSATSAVTGGILPERPAASLPNDSGRNCKNYKLPSTFQSKPAILYSTRLCPHVAFPIAESIALNRNQVATDPSQLVARDICIRIARYEVCRDAASHLMCCEKRFTAAHRTHPASHRTRQLVSLNGLNGCFNRWYCTREQSDSI